MQQMKLPRDSINEKNDETNKMISNVKRQLTELDIPDYVQALQLSSLDKRLQELTEEETEKNR